MFFDANQLYVSAVAVLVAALLASLIIFLRERPRGAIRGWAVACLGALALVSLLSWARFGDMHGIWLDAPGVAAGQPGRRKIERHQPFHFHEFFHYYLGAKYFRDLGYVGLYDCTALGDRENAEALGVPPHIGGWVRDLEDVLLDKSYEDALAHCQRDYVAKMPPAHWAAFKADLRELQTIVPDDWWGGVTFDAGFNPPPSWILFGGSLANLIPIHLAGSPSYLLATGLDTMLLVVCFLVLRSALGSAVATTAAIFFGASFIASYGWNGGCFLRYTWVTGVVVGIAAASRGRWTLAGAMLGLAACDRIFPAGFAVGAAAPLAWGALRSPADRARLKQLGLGFGGVVLLLAVASTIAFGIDAWRVFFTRIGKHGDVYYTMHIGLKKLITWRDWTASQNFHGHEGLGRFRDWNLRLRDTWHETQWLAKPVQLAALGGAVWAATRRKPHEAAILVGVTAMFCFALPANYYYVVLALVPALLLRAAVLARTVGPRIRDWALLSVFVVFWIGTMLAPRMWGDDIVYNHFICLSLAAFLGLWIVAWQQWEPLLARLRARTSAAPPAT